ncbi:uncharacterized protein [Watersipora subatra]|uniref:uncharacterized protein n=1 Tax=Watersipora subatra TaxID=2589382 RepID=UPI00355BA15C
MMASSIHATLLLIFTLFLTLSVDSAEAYVYYYNTWYIYVIVVFVVIAISSCIGACVRYKRNQMILEQRRIIVSQGAPINVTTTGGAVNGGYNPPIYAPGSYPTQPVGGYMQHPPAYNAAAQPEKDPNMPPAYDDALSAPTTGAPNYPPQPQAGNPPYPTQPMP